MADLRDYKNKNFSITVNSRMKGIELRFENTMTEEQIEQIKEAGFRWSKRQQMWYAYQNEKTIAYAKSLESQYEDNLENNEIKQEKAEPSQIEQTVLLQDLIAELREEIRKQNEKIKELEEIIEERNNENEEILLEAENGEKMTIDEYNQWNEEQVLQEEIDDLQEGKNFISSLIQEESEIILTEEELEICRKIIPANQYAYTLELTQGEEGDFYKQKLKDIAKITQKMTTKDELVNEDGSHNVALHYFVGNSDFYISQLYPDGTAFGYTILNGDVEMAEWGYQNIEEIINVSQWIEMDYHVPEGMTIERMLEEKYPEYYKQESVVEIEQQSDVIVPREKIFSIFNKYISNEEYATEKANKFIKGWENKDFNSLAEGLVFKKDTTAELRKLFNETEKVSLPEGNSNHLEVYTYLTKFADVETIPTEGKFNTWNDVIDYDIEVRTSLENKNNIFNFFQTHTSQTERTNYLKKEYSNGGGGVLPFNYVYTSDGIYLKALIDGKIKEKSYTWAEYTKFISDKISQGTYYTEPKIEKVTNKLIPSFNLLNEKYAIEFEPADEGKIDVNSEADKWIVKFYDISKIIPGEIDKGRFIQKYYASSLLQNQNSTVGLNLGYGWSLDAETFTHAKELIKDFVSIDMSEIFSSKQNINDEYSESLSEYSMDLIKNINSNKFSFILEKLSAAGIEVVTDKNEFNRILEREELLQKMAIDFSEFEKLEESINNQKSSNLHLQDEKFDLESQKKIIQQKNHTKFVEVVKQLEKYIPTNEKYIDNFGHLRSFAKVLINNTEPENDDRKNIFLIKVNNPHQNDIFVVTRDFQISSLKILGELNNFEKLSQDERLQTLFSDTVIIDNFTENLKSYMQQQLVIEQQKQNKLINEVHSSMQKLKEMDIKNSDILSDFVQLDKSLRFNSNFEIESSSLNEMVSVFPGSTGKSGLGIRHIIEERYKKDNLSQDEITALSALILETVKTGELTRDSKNRCEITKNGIIAIIRKDFDDRDENWILTGFQYKGENEEKNREATEAIQTVIAQYSHSLEYSYFRNQVGAVISSLDLNISQTENKSTTQNFITPDGTIYGFAHDEKIYLNPDIVSSEATIHEYTHLWDNYTKVTNPELWNKGKEVFKNTYLWEEVKNDPNYQDISHDEDLILSECHARITGKIADQILEKIQKENGELTKGTVIDWDNEVFEYISKEFVSKDIDIQSVSEFVSQTMKDFMEGKKLDLSKTVQQEKHLSQTSEPHTKKEIKNIREQCREILQKNDNEITEEDKLILAQYEGGGGIDEDSRTSAQVLNEFYTPNNLIEKVWNLVDAYHPNGKTVLEPTAGIGKFANNRPNNQFTMHELDETSARINKILHPEANIIQGAYQKQFLDEHERILNEDYVQPKYDIVIGNPPYGEYSGKYKNIEGKHHQRYEEYFIEKGLDALKDENSILAYVVPSGFLDSKNDKQKELIASKGQFVDAYRLPAGTFSTTDVGTDILIMRSWEKVRKEFDKDFTNDGHLITKEEAFKSFQRGNAELLSNGEYFKDHPEKILGEIKQRTNQFGKLVDTVVHHEGLSIQDELNKIDDFVADIKKGNTYENHQESNIEIIEEELEELEVIEEVKEETPQRNKITTKTKEENQEKRLAPVMTSEEFSKLYGRDFKAEELPIWKATDWEGNIDTSKLSFQEENLLHESSNYVEIEPGKFTHRVLFESGDIGSKIEDYKAKIKVIQFNNEDSAERKIALYEKNIAELEKITPTKIPMERLHFGLNSTLSEEFMVEHINAEGEIVKLNLQESFILWAKGQTYAEVTDKKTYYWRGGIDFATANISQEDFPQSVSWYDIVEYIDKKPVKAERVTGTWNKEDDEIKADKAQARREADEKRMARSETADKLFDKYLHEGLSEDLSKRVEAEYNRRFNSYVIPDYSKLPLFIDGISRTKNGKKFKLYDQQIKGVSFLCNKGNGLLAYDVGVGKTAAGIVATVNQIQTGRSKRPVIVVPNAVYAKWYNDICELFPNIKVNDLYNLNKESTEKYRNKDNPHKLDIEENSISLITYEGLKNITFNDQSCENELFNDFSKLLSVDFDGSSRENAKNADNIKNAIGISSQVKNTNYVFFEDCGFDNITVDEAHNFKNLWTVPRPKNKGESNEFAGIPSGKPSARALKLFAMTQYTQRHNDDRNVFLLTATPFTNSPLEVYSMLSYVGRKRLIDSGLYSLRDFCNQFAHTKLELGVNSKGEIDQKQVMKDWKELPALQKILTEFIDKVDGEELKEIIRPKKFTHVQELEMSPLQKQMMEIDTQLMNEVKEGNSAAVIVSMNAMRVGLVAPALADPARYPDLELPSMEKLVETSPKLKFVCDSVIDMYKNHPEKGQFIFMPLGQTAHGIVKDYLIAHGIPKETVEIINGSINNTTEKKDKLTQKFNNPKEKCKILIGGKNTSEGIDLNGNSFAMYNCSLGWNPSETIQAEGRIWRQGNQQGHVHCVYPVMNDSIDSLLYQKHDEKRSRINELWTYKDSDTLNIEDINPEDLKFDLIKDPQKRAKLILENGIDTEDFKFVGTKSIKNELNKVNNRIKSFDEVYEKRINLKKNLEEAEFNIQRIEKNIEDYKNADLETPEWCKAELKDNRKYKTNYEHQLETISRKFASWGIKDEKELEEFIPNLNKQKRTLETELQAKEKELPKILKMEMLKLNEKKVLLPSISEQRKILTEDIQKNLRPMIEVEPEIRTERFEQMLNLKWERGEISADEAELYSSAGYKNYYAWLDGEIESLYVENIVEKQTEIVQEKTVDISTDKKVEEKQNASNSFSGELFSESELEELTTINEKLNPQLKKHQVIYYYEDSGIDEGLDFMTLSEAQQEGKKSIKEWNLDKSENGFAIFNRETKQIEAIHGYFPVEKVFRNEILAINGYKVDESKQEVSLSEIQKSTKEKLAEQGASKEHFDSHAVFATLDKIKKEYADSYEW